MKQQPFFAMLVAIISITACGSNSAIGANYDTAQPYLPVSLSVESDDHGVLREFPLNNDPAHYRAYLQALPNQRYSLHVTNNSNQRVGLVIAVDGRNIVNGKQSWLGNNESMYVLAPHDSADYEGWRTATDQTNRFYFTEVDNSYAAAWGDTSAMGVIAMAVYPERSPPQTYSQPEDYQQRNTPARGIRGLNEGKGSALFGADAAASAPAPGTGFGETNYSPSTKIEFKPTEEQMEKIVLKYEWRETLCSKGVLPECSQKNTQPNNRMWRDDNSGFAPPPPQLH
jgi:hypothetical protein